MARKRDLLHECNVHGIPKDEFEATFCQRCRQTLCGKAAWGTPLMEERVARQIKRLLHPVQVDPKLAKYASLMDFKDMAHRAAQLEIADRRGDWEVPEIPVTDGVVEVHSSETVDAAVDAMKATSRYIPKPHFAVPMPDPDEPSLADIEYPELSPLPHDQHIPEEMDPEDASLFSDLRKPKPKSFVPPTGKNAPSTQGVMLDGSPAPPPKPLPPEPVEEADPWAPPPGAVPVSSKPKIRTVPVGATVKMGSEK